MTVRNANSPAVAAFADWELTDEGKFLNKKSGKTFTRQEWEIEISYDHADNPDALALAKKISEQAAQLTSA